MKQDKRERAENKIRNMAAMSVALGLALLAAGCRTERQLDGTNLLHLSHVHRGGGKLERPDNTLDTFM